MSKGLIRFIGRYWSTDSTYVVTLKTKNNEDSPLIKLKVQKPQKLGEEPNTLNNKKDVLGNTFNIVLLSIYTSGGIGVPPQIIKGHMEKETTFENSYRYEPSKDIAEHKIILSKNKEYLHTMIHIIQ